MDTYLLILLVLTSISSGVYFFMHLAKRKQHLIAGLEEYKTLLDTTKLEANNLQEQNWHLSLINTETKVRLELTNSQLVSLSNEKNKITEQNMALQKQVECLKTENASMEQLNIALTKEKLKLKEEEKERYETLETFLSEKFKSIAQGILHEKSEDFKLKSKDQLDTLLTPLKMRLEDFNKQIQESDKERYSLKTQLQQINTLSCNLIEQTKNLSDSLRGNNKIQGTWGEIVLEKILELSGLQRDSQFTCQTSSTGSAENLLRPDAIVYLPNDRHVIIDAKTSFKSYDAYCNASEQQDREIALKLFLQSLKKHIKNLGSKDYHKIGSLHTVDFVIMFIPIEGAFVLGYQDLYQFAWENNIVLASPTTIIPILRMINFLWKEKNQHENYHKIAQAAGNIHDKICAILVDVKKIKEQINLLNSRSNELWDDIYAKKIRGRGGIISNLNELEKMGAITKKEILKSEDVEVVS